MLRIATVSILAIVAGACASAPEDFIPAEMASGITPEGYAAADYEMIVEGSRLGDVMVWSDGAYRADVNGERRTVIHVGFDVSSYVDVPIEINPQVAELRIQVNGSIVRQEADFIAGPQTVAPNTDQTLSMYFVLPRGVEPQHIDAFRISWKATAKGLTYAQRTPFIEYEPAYYYPYYGPTWGFGYYYSPFYDPFYYYPYAAYGPAIIHPTPYRHRPNQFYSRRP